MAFEKLYIFPVFHKSSPCNFPEKLEGGGMPNDTRPKRVQTFFILFISCARCDSAGPIARTVIPDSVHRFPRCPTCGNALSPSSGSCAFIAKVRARDSAEALAMTYHAVQAYAKRLTKREEKNAQ